MKDAPSSRTTLILLIACGMALFALTVLLKAYDNSPLAASERSQPGSYSTSAIGYAGLYDVLRRMERPVTRSTGNSLAMVGGSGTLVVAEPDLYRMNSAAGLKLNAAPRLLLVLPKRQATQDSAKPAWISQAKMLPLIMVHHTLNLVSSYGTIAREKWPERWAVNDLGFNPRPAPGVEVVQLIRSPEMRCLVGTENGILLGELKDSRYKVWVLADPDIMANHGLGHGDNAAFMLALLDKLRAYNNQDLSAPIVFDETMHGYEAARGSALKLVFSFPFVVVSILVLATGLLLVLAGGRRFGAPFIPRPALDSGKSKLIANSAQLLDYAGHHAVVMKRYVQMTIKSAGQALHAPPRLAENELADWLDRIGKARQVNRSCYAIWQASKKLGNNQADLIRLLECVRDIYIWKGEILNGTSAGRRNN